MILDTNSDQTMVLPNNPAPTRPGDVSDIVAHAIGEIERLTEDIDGEVSDYRPILIARPSEVLLARSHGNGDTHESQADDR